MDKNKIIEYRKRNSELSKESFKINKEEFCLICGGKFSSFCNSHSIPKFILSNICYNGMVLQSGTMDVEDNEIKKNKLGINEAGLFFNICRNCDNFFFKEYESIDELERLRNELAKNKFIFSRETKIKLAKIYYKCLLREIYTKKDDKYKNGKEFDELVKEGILDGHQIYSNYQLDLRDYYREKNILEEIINGNSITNMFVIDFIELPYEVAIATQTLIALQNDLKGNLINNIYNFSNDYYIEHICFVCFPVKNKTIIILFGIEITKERHINFISQYKKLNLDEKLKLIQSIIFSYSDECYFSPLLNDFLLKDKNFIEMASQANGPEITHSKIVEDRQYFYTGKVDISNFKKIENYLSRKYSTLSIQNRKVKLKK